MPAFGRIPRIQSATLPFWLVVLLVGCSTSPAKGPPDQLLLQGKKYAEEERRWKAARQFRGVTVNHPSSDEAEEATFLQAENFRRMKKSANAFSAYKELVENFPNSKYGVGAAEGEFALGVDHFEGRIPGFLFFAADREFGVRIMQHMQVHYPNSRLADDALIRTADYHIDEGYYSLAAQALRDLLSRYPRSEHALRARFQLGRVLWLQNRGAPYDQQLLSDSRRAFADFIGTVNIDRKADLFPKHLEQAQEMITKITERLAEREYVTGEFYERTKAPASAMVHYRACMREYPQTQHAKASEEALARLSAVAAEAQDATEQPEKAPAAK